MEVIYVEILIIILVTFIAYRSILVLKKEKDSLKAEIDQLRLTNREDRDKLIKAEEQLIAQRERQLQQEMFVKELQYQSKIEFENIANKVLDEKSAKFTAQNRINLDLIINPLKENIKAFEDKVDKVYKSESDERNVLKGVINQLMDQSKMISDEAANLTKALKGDVKKQGNWGEVILSKILERSGLVQGSEYRIQNSFNQEEGGRLQPDVIIDLPDQKHIVVDAKVSLVAYERFLNANEEIERDAHLKQHLISIKNHIQLLASKSYQELYQINSPDFVLLFVPIESSFGLAVQQDSELFNFAWDRKIVIVSPSTLLATLRTIASIWKQERQTKNVLEIARLSGTMYDKFVGFLSDMENIGKSIKQSQDTYEKAIGKLSTGSGNLTLTAHKIKKLGAKANKSIDTKFIDQEFTDD